jgi:hypothetical protein
MWNYQFEDVFMKKVLLLSILVIGVYYSSAFLYYQYILPYSVGNGSLLINNHLDYEEIEYNDPDISYRDMKVIIKHIAGGPLEITYIKCSDDYKVNLTEGSVSFTHNFAGNIYIRLLYENSSANISYTIIDRTSLFVPKSATKACTSMPGIIFGFNITLVLIFSSLIFVFGYFIIFKRDLLITKLKNG